MVRVVDCRLSHVVGVFEPLLGTLCCVLGQDTSLSHCHSLSLILIRPMRTLEAGPLSTQVNKWILVKFNALGRGRGVTLQ